MKTTETKQVAKHATGSTGRRLPEPQSVDFPNFATYILCLWALQGTSIDELVNFDQELMGAGRHEAGWIIQGYIQQKFAAAGQVIPFEQEWILRLAETYDYNSEVDWAAIGDWVIAQMEPRP